jgi:ethanolamine utilization cobalamin adenosyltransferase
MKAVTEAYLRKCFREGEPASFTLDAGMILTPAARQFLRDRRIELTAGTNPPAPANRSRNGKAPYISLDSGRLFDQKPEELTQLHGKTLVRKDHPRIQLRGRLDSLQSDILLLHSRYGAAAPELAADLAELLGWARELLRAEVLETAPAEMTISGLTAGELHERSHNPRKFFKIGHVLPGVEMSLPVLELNKLRSTVREVELVAVAALADTKTPWGQQIIETLNRMSSGIYFLMLTHLTGNYGHE